MRSRTDSMPLEGLLRSHSPTSSRVRRTSSSEESEDRLRAPSSPRMVKQPSPRKPRQIAEPLEIVSSPRRKESSSEESRSKYRDTSSEALRVSSQRTHLARRRWDIPGRQMSELLEGFRLATEEVLLGEQRSSGRVCRPEGAPPSPQQTLKLESSHFSLEEG